MSKSNNITWICQHRGLRMGCPRQLKSLRINAKNLELTKDISHVDLENKPSSQSILFMQANHGCLCT